MKIKATVLSLALVAALFTGCGAKQAEAPKADVKTTASVVNDNAAFEKALGATGGKYVVATLKDLTFTKDLVVEGEYKTGKKDANGNLILDAEGKEATQRKIALYTQDENHKVTARFTLTAPKITFNSNYGSIEHGTFKGDVYVAGKYFKLVNATIEGNIYFLNQEAMDTFKIADGKPEADSVATTISGVKELKK